MYCIAKGRAKVMVYIDKECECCGHMHEDEEMQEKEITALVDVPSIDVEVVTAYLESHVEKTTEPGEQILLIKWIDTPTIEDLHPDLVNRIIGAPELIEVEPLSHKRPAYQRLASKLVMSNFIKSMAAAEVN